MGHLSEKKRVWGAQEISVPRCTSRMDSDNHCSGHRRPWGLAAVGEFQAASGPEGGGGGETRGMQIIS